PAIEKRRAHALLRDALAVAGLRQQVVLDVVPHALRLVRKRAVVELAEDRLARAGQQIRRDDGVALNAARLVELAANEAQQRRLDLDIRQLLDARDEADDLRGDAFAHEARARP